MKAARICGIERKLRFSPQISFPFVKSLRRKRTRRIRTCQHSRTPLHTLIAYTTSPLQYSPFSWSSHPIHAKELLQLFLLNWQHQIIINNGESNHKGIQGGPHWQQSLTPQALRLLSKEVVTLRNDPPEGVRVVVDEEDLTAMEGWVQGPCKCCHATDFTRLFLISWDLILMNSRNTLWRRILSSSIWIWTWIS
jgi:hypothetical protein